MEGNLVICNLLHAPLCLPFCRLQQSSHRKRKVWLVCSVAPPARSLPATLPPCSSRPGPSNTWRWSWLTLRPRSDDLDKSCEYRAGRVQDTPQNNLQKLFSYENQKIKCSLTQEDEEKSAIYIYVIYTIRRAGHFHFIQHLLQFYIQKSIIQQICNKRAKKEL